MKTKAKRASLRVIATILGVVILITSLGLVSLITVNAYGTLVFYYKMGSGGTWQNTTVTLSSNEGYVDIEVAGGTTMYSAIKTDNNEWYGNQSLAPGSTRNLASLDSNYNYTTGSNNNTFTPSSTKTYRFSFSMGGTKSISVDNGTGGGGDTPAESSYSIAGRMLIHNSTGGEVCTGNRSDDSVGWSTSSTTIKFQQTDDANIYVVHTFTSEADLAKKLSDANWNPYQYFYVYDSANSKYYMPGTADGDNITTEVSTENTQYDANQYDSRVDNRFFKFTGSDTTSYVDIYFNSSTHKLWYELVDPVYTYYMEGRLNFTWTQDETTYPLTKVDDHLFVYHTELTVSELASTYNDGGDQTRYFYLERHKDGTASTTHEYVHSSNNTHQAVSAAYSTTYAASISNSYASANGHFWYFTGSGSDKLVDIYYDETSNRIYYKLVADYHYYIEGRFKVRDSAGNETTISSWSNTSISIPFTETATEGLYVLKTNSTLAELSADINNNPAYLRVGRQMGTRTINYWYLPTENSATLEENEAGVPQELAGTDSNDGNSFKFVTSTNPYYVDIYFDLTNPAAPKLYFELVEPTYDYYLEGRFAVKSSDRSTTTYLGGTANTWTHTAKNLKFQATATSGLYKLETNMTVNELTKGGGSDKEYYFVLGRSSRGADPAVYFEPYSDKTVKASDANKKFEGEWASAINRHYLFNDLTSDNSDALVTFYYNENTDQFYFTLTPAEYDTTIYIINNSGWTDLNIFTWLEGQDDHKTFGSFPGTDIKAGDKFSYGHYTVIKNGDNKYTVKFNKDGADHILFTDGDQGSEEGAYNDKQTADLALVNGQTYIIKSTKTNQKNNVEIADGQVVNFVAKDGMIRDSSHMSFGEYATTSVTAAANKVSVDSPPTNAYSNTNYVTGWATKGNPITVTTTISGTDDKAKYYVAGFSFNGYTPQILAENDTGVYECTYTIPKDFAYDTLEITPIYFLKSAYSNYYTTFNISGYENVKNEGWGSTLYIYPFYDTSVDGGVARNFGSYPGQPVIYNGGRFYTQIPSTTDGTFSGGQIKGVTINNGYWDLRHRAVEGWPDNNKAYHHQTYDYDDFYKLYKENGSNLNSIYFTFKYEEAQAHRTTVPSNHNSSNAADYRHDDIPDTLSQSALDAYGSKNGFEDYKNANGKMVDLFGDVLSSADLAKDPIYVISQGYEYNNSGSFATEWVVFYWDEENDRYQKVTESTTNFTSIVPSALHIRDYEHIAQNYPALNNDMSITVFENIYRALENYKERPVKICYEKDIKAGHYYRNGQGGEDEAYRLDGIWSYTLKTDFVTANTLIEYTDDNGASWHEDAFVDNSATGSNTKCKAYFTYESDAKNGYGSSFDGKNTVSGVYVDDSKYFTFKAESAGLYEFVGWTLRDPAGNETAITADSNNVGQTKMSSSATMIARFKKVTSGSLIVSHSLHPTSEGLGTTFLGVRILDGSNAVIETIADEETNTVAKTIGKEYIISDSSYKIKITLKTVLLGENTFNKYQVSENGEESIDSDDTYLPTGDPSVDGATLTKDIVIPITALFGGGSTQVVTSLGYYSLLNETLNKYDVTFNYTDRNNASKSMRVMGTFTPGQMKNYVTGTGTVKTVNSAFFNEIKPKVSNFKNDITFNFAAAATASTTSWDYAPATTTYTMTLTVSSSPTANLNRIVTFKTPYAMTNFIPTESASYPGTYEYLSSPVESEPITGQYGNLVKINDGSFNLASGSFVTAPKTLVDHKGTEDLRDDVTYYFKCWNMYTSDNKLVAACYFPEFNYLLYDNYTVEAEYSTDTTKYYEYFNTQKAVSATFLKNTRTQWNTGADGTSTPEADLIYSDFALSFKYGGMKFYEDGWSSNYEIGIILQRLEPVEMDSDGAHTKTIAQYESKYSGTLSTADRTNIINYIKGSGAAPTGTRKTTFTYDKLDNKNRMEYYIGQYNSKSWDEENQTWVYSKWDNENSAWTTGDGLNTNSKFVYRLFTYVYDINAAENKVLLSDPAYFYMYNTVNQ